MRRVECRYIIKTYLTHCFTVCTRVSQRVITLSALAMASCLSEKIEEDVHLDDLAIDTEALLGNIEGQSHIRAKWQQPIHYAPAGWRMLKSVGYALLPSFLQRSGPQSDKSQKTGQNIATLDGLRGIACLIVVNQHFTYNFTENIFHGFGSTETDRYITQLPFISLLWSGVAMVSVFFVISGYVLSNKPLRLARARSWDNLHETMASAAFRRIIRLYVPMASSLFIITMMAYFGLFEPGRAVKAAGVLTGNEPVPDRFDNLASHLWEWYLNVWLYWAPGASAERCFLDLHLWTLPTELRTSFTLFLTLIALSKLAYRWRAAMLILIMCFCSWWRRDAQILFLSGMFLADLDQHLAESHGPSKEELQTTSGPRKRVRIAYLVTFVLGLFLSSSPNWGADQSTYYGWLTRFNPPQWGDDGTFMKTMGAIVLVFASNRGPDVQFLFTNRFAQYLGKVRRVSLS